MRRPYITATGPRATEWRNVFGTNRLAVKSQLPVMVEIEKLGQREAFMLDFDDLTDGQISSLVSHLARQWNADPDQVREEILRRGFPVLVDGNLVQPGVDMRFVV